MSTTNYVIESDRITEQLGFNEQYFQLIFVPNTDLMLSLINVSYWMDNTTFSYSETSDFSFKLPCRVQIFFNGGPQTTITDLLLKLNCVRVYKAVDDKIYVNFTVNLPNGIILPRKAPGGVVVRIRFYGNTLLAILDPDNSSKTANCLFTMGGIGMTM